MNSTTTHTTYNSVYYSTDCVIEILIQKNCFNNLKLMLKETDLRGECFSSKYIF